MNIKVIKDKISRQELKQIAKEGFGDLVKAVVDIDKGIMAVGGEFHSDGEVILMEQEDSKRENTWGINFYPEKDGEEWIEFDSVINLKPFYGNRSRGVAHSEIKDKIREIIGKLVSK